MTKPNPARPGLSPPDDPTRITSLADKMARLLDRLDGKASLSWRDDMDLSIAWRFWMLDATEAVIEQAAPLLTVMPEDQYDRAHRHVFSMAKATGIAPSDPKTKKRHLDLILVVASKGDARRSGWASWHRKEPLLRAGEERVVPSSRHRRGREASRAGAQHRRLSAQRPQTVKDEASFDPHSSYAALRICGRIAALDEVLGVIATLRNGKAETRTIDALVAMPEVQRLSGEWSLWKRLAERAGHSPEDELIGYLDEERVAQARFAIWGTKHPKLRRVK